MGKNDRTIQWINKMLQTLSKLEENKGITILHECGANCSKTSKFLNGALKIRNEYINNTNPDDLFNSFKKEYYNTSNLTKDGNTIILIFETCTCPMVKEGVTNSYLCNCTVGYTKKIFETLFGTNIKINLEQSILRGDTICKQVIHIGE